MDKVNTKRQAKIRNVCTFSVSEYQRPNFTDMIDKKWRSFLESLTLMAYQFQAMAKLQKWNLRLQIKTASQTECRTFN
jgi:hypothetical protein